MADDVSQQIENALNMIVNFTDKSGNLKKELKNSIHEAVSNLRNLIFVLKSNLLEKTEEYNKTRKEVKQLKDALEKEKATSTARLVAPSVNSNPALISRGRAVPAPPSGDKKKLFSEIVCGKSEERHKLTVKPKENQSSEEIKKLLKSKIDPVNMKIGIRAFKSLKNGNVLIEADSKEEIDLLNSQIHDKCGDQLEINIQKRRNPRLIIYNVPDAVTPENAEDIIIAQNPDLKLQEGDIQTKFTFKTKRKTRNLVIEVNPQTRRQLLQNKLKLEWMICKVDDYISVNRCFKCSGYNHRHTECRSEEACPLCAGKHKLKECTASKPDYKCINCVKYNTYNKDRKTHENHSSLDWSCPSLQAMIDKYRQNTNY